MANPKQTQTHALTDWLWSKLWVDLAQLPNQEKKASAKKMGVGVGEVLHVLRSAFIDKNTHWCHFSSMDISLKTFTERVSACARMSRGGGVAQELQ